MAKKTKVTKATGAVADAVKAKLAAKAAGSKVTAEIVKAAAAAAKGGKKAARTTPGTEKVSTAAFIKAEIARQAKSKKTDEEILAAARKRPEAKGQKIGGHYVSWYRWQMSKDGGKGGKSARA